MVQLVTSTHAGLAGKGAKCMLARPRQLKPESGTGTCLIIILSLDQFPADSLSLPKMITGSIPAAAPAEGQVLFRAVFCNW